MCQIFPIPIRDLRELDFSSCSIVDVAMFGRLHLAVRRVPIRAVMHGSGSSSYAQRNMRRLSTAAQPYSLGRKLLLASVSSSVGVAGLLLTMEKWESKLPEDVRALCRIMNLTIAVTVVVVDYAYAMATRSHDTEYDEQLASEYSLCPLLLYVKTCFRRTSFHAFSLCLTRIARSARRIRSDIRGSQSINKQKE